MLNKTYYILYHNALHKHEVVRKGVSWSFLACNMFYIFSDHGRYVWQYILFWVIAPFVTLDVLLYLSMSDPKNDTIAITAMLTLLWMTIGNLYMFVDINKLIKKVLIKKHGYEYKASVRAINDEEAFSAYLKSFAEKWH